MSLAVKVLAEKYYPLLWPLERLDALKEAGKLTEDEYNEIVRTET